MKISFPIEEEWINEIMSVVAGCLVPAVVSGAWEFARMGNRTPTDDDLARARAIAVNEWLLTMTEIAGRMPAKGPEPSDGSLGVPPDPAH